MKIGKSEEKVYTYLKSKIDQGILGPNTKIIETELASTLDLSRSPVRRAVKRLAHEGYLTVEANKGAVVKGKPLGSAAYVDYLEVFELLLVQFMFQLESKRLPWVYEGLTEDLTAFKQALSAPGELATAQQLGLGLTAKSLAQQKNGYQQTLILTTLSELFKVGHLNLELTDRQVLQIFHQYTTRWLTCLAAGDFASARREVRIFVNELTLAVIDQQDLNNLKKYGV